MSRDVVTFRYGMVRGHLGLGGVISAFAVRVIVVVQEQRGGVGAEGAVVSVMMPWIFGSAWSNPDNVPWYPGQAARRGLQSWRRVGRTRFTWQTGVHGSWRKLSTVPPLRLFTSTTTTTFDSPTQSLSTPRLPPRLAI